MGITKHFGTENYAWRLDIVQNLSEFKKKKFYDFLDQKWPSTTNIYTICEGA